MTFTRLTIVAGLFLAVSACATTPQDAPAPMGGGAMPAPAATTSAAPPASTHGAVPAQGGAERL